MSPFTFFFCLLEYSKKNFNCNCKEKKQRTLLQDKEINLLVIYLFTKPREISAGKIIKLKKLNKKKTIRQVKKNRSIIFSMDKGL